MAKSRAVVLGARQPDGSCTFQQCVNYSDTELAAVDVCSAARGVSVFFSYSRSWRLSRFYNHEIKSTLIIHFPSILISITPLNMSTRQNSKRGHLNGPELAGRGRWLHARANEINKAHQHGAALHRQTAVVSRATAQSACPKQRPSPSNQTPSRVAARRSNHSLQFAPTADWCAHVEVMYAVLGCMSIANECDVAVVFAYAPPRCNVCGTALLAD